MCIHAIIISALVDDKRMKDALTRPEVQQVLKDENIQKLMNSLMKDRNEAQR